MIKNNKELFHATLCIIFGTIGGMLVSVVQSGPYLFSIQSPAAQYYYLSIGLATLIAIYFHAGLLNSIIYVFPLALLSAVPGQRLYFTNILNILLFLAFGITAFYFIWTRFSRSFVFGKFLLLGAAGALYECVRVPVLSIAFAQTELIIPTLQTSMLLTSTIAGGVGLGIELAELVGKRLPGKTHVSMAA